MVNIFSTRKFNLICLGGLNTDLRQLQIPLFFNKVAECGHKITFVGVTGCFNTYPPLIADLFSSIKHAVSNTKSSMGVVILGMSIDAITVVRYACKDLDVDGIILINPFFRYEICPHISDHVSVIAGILIPNVHVVDTLEYVNNILGKRSEEVRVTKPFITDVSSDSSLLVRVNNDIVPELTFRMVGNAIRYKNEHVQSVCQGIEYELIEKYVLIVSAGGDMIAEPELDNFFHAIESKNTKHIHRCVENSNHAVDAIDAHKGTRVDNINTYIFHVMNFLDSILRK